MTVAVSREGSDVYDLSDFVDNTLVPYVGRTSGVSSVSANGLIEKMVQVQLNQDKIDEVNARLLELIDTQLADARAQLDAAEAQIAEGRAEYEKQLKNFGNTVSDTVMAEMGTEVADAVTVVRDQAQALLNSVNQLIGVVNEPEIQQAHRRPRRPAACRGPVQPDRYAGHRLPHRDRRRAARHHR